MNINSLAQDLENILKREIQSFRAVDELLMLEEKALITSDRQALVSVMERQEDVFTSLACLEKSRSDIIVKIAAVLDIAPEEVTLNSVAGHVHDTLKTSLLETRHVLDRLHTGVQARKSRNNLLVKQAIMMVEKDIRCVMNAASRNTSKQAVYAPGAERQPASQSICVDKRR